MKQKFLSSLVLLFLLISPLAKGQVPTLPEGVVFPDNISDKECFVIPKGFKWDIAKKYQSAISPSTMRVQSYANLLVGNVTGDPSGIPKIITLNFLTDSNFSNGILIFNNDLSLYRSIPVPSAESYVTLPLAIGDVNGDGEAEIIYGTGYRNISDPNLYYRLQAYKANGTLVWTSNATYMQSFNSTYFHSSSICIANLDGDDNVEIFAGDRIFDGKTGNLLATLPTAPIIASPVNMNVNGVATNGRGMHYNASSTVTSGYLPAIGDIDGDGILEIVCGNTTYKVTINDRANPALNTVTIVGQIDMVDGYTSLADIDGDGITDVVVVGRPTNGADSQMYVWSGVGTSGNKIGQTVLGSSYKLVASDPGYVAAYAATYGQNGSRPFIGDIDGDGKPEIAYTSRTLLGIFSYNATTKLFERRYRTGTTDTSAATTLSLFDFNQDGRSEMVYRDETLLRIMQFKDDGAGGFTCEETTFPCRSGTHTEYPTIADINNDGHAEIIVSGADIVANSPYDAGSANSNIRVMVFGSPSNSWASARRVWNQHAYNAININEDLTIPKRQINPATVFPGADGDLATTGDNVRPFNNFLQQQTTLSKWGTQLWLAPNGQISGTPEFSYNETDDKMTVTVKVHNVGDAIFQSPFYVTAYKDNVGSTPKYTYRYNNTIAVDETVTLSFDIEHFDRDWCPYNFIVLKINDDGDDGTGNQAVCLESQNLYRYYGILPVSQEVCVGEEEMMTCSFALSTGDTYQWQWSKDGIIWTNISGATAISYTPTEHRRGITYYRVIVTNDAATETIYSAPAHIEAKSCKLPVNHNISAMEYYD
ncbi:MAG: FG-GAP-like repeat-containing protein [Prevotella sp.]|jgi:hypothetical protein|nr:FG-GAP-like repeat-containing protein [Prevotella sp.]